MTSADSPETSPEAESAGTNGQQAAAKRPRKSSPLTKPLPTARIAFAKQLQLLLAYASKYEQTKQPVSNADVAGVVELAEQTVSLANAFFTSTGFLAKVDPGYVPSSAVGSYHRTYQFSPDGAARELLPVLVETWFARALLLKVTVAGSISVDQARMALSRESGATVEYRAQLDMLIEYLVAGGVLIRDGDQLRRPITPGERQDGATEGRPDSPPPPPPPPLPPGDPGLHPLIQGLLQELPQPGSKWSRAKHDAWLALAKAAFGILYEIEPNEAAGKGSAGSPSSVENPP
jgi:hypothetical protein